MGAAGRLMVTFQPKSNDSIPPKSETPRIALYGLKFEGRTRMKIVNVHQCTTCLNTYKEWGDMREHLDSTGHLQWRYVPLKQPESDGQAEQPKSMADYASTLSPKELLNYYPEAAEDDEQEDRRRAKKKASQVTEVWGGRNDADGKGV